MNNEFQQIVLNAKADLRNTITEYIKANIKQVSRAEQEEARSKVRCYGNYIEVKDGVEVQPFILEIMCQALSRIAQQLTDEDLNALENAEFTYSFEDGKLFSMMVTTPYPEGTQFVK
jgi:hypothetical protein